MVLSPATPHDYYRILGVPRDADAAAIKDAFHRLARRYHPDRSKEPDAEDRFKEITEAYTTLSDPGMRAEYDAGHGNPPAGGWTGTRAGSGRVFTFGLRPDEQARRSPSCFSGDGGGSRGDKGSDIRLDVEIPLSAVASGTQETVEYTRLFPCRACHGRGTRSGTSLRLCAACGGVGRVPVLRLHGDPIVRSSMTCEVCGGTGLVVDDQCPDCSGSGLCPGRQWLKVRIPAGIGDGTVLRVRGRGLPSRSAGDRFGDLYLVVRVAPHPDLVPSGADLWRRESIPVADAVLGVHLDVPCLGHTVSAEVPPGTQPGTVLRFAGHGLPRPGGGQQGANGDLYVVVDVVIPATLSSGERRMYEQLRAASRPARRPWHWRRRRAAKEPPPPPPA